MPTFTSMVEELAVHARKLDEHMAAQGLGSPSFDHDPLAGQQLPEELAIARNALSNGANDLKNLSMGPVVRGLEMALGWTELLALRVVYHLELPKHVPLDGGSISYAELGAAVQQPAALVRRFVRMCIANRVLDEDAAGRVRHTAISRLLATDALFAACVGLQLEELGDAGGAYLRALERWGAAGMTEPTTTAFALHNGIDVPIFAFLGAQPQRAQRFGMAMRFFTADDSWDLRHIANAFDWAALDRPGALVVDVGGGAGHVSYYLAARTQQLAFRVQDLPHVVEKARAEPVPAGIDPGRVAFEAHDFLSPQPAGVQPDAFLLRWILHDWPEQYAVKILKSLVPALKPGAKVLIYEYVFDDQPVKDVTKRTGLVNDMIMAACFNGMERDMEGFKSLVAQADPRFVVERRSQPKGSTQSLVEVTWRP